MDEQMKAPAPDAPADAQVPADQQDEVIKMCIDRRLPPGEDDDVKFMAAKANRANKVERTRLDPATGQSISIAFEYRKCWAPGTVLHVRFLNGLAEVQQKVAAIAQEWTKVANIHLVFDNAPDAQIRIAFNPGGSWSRVGMDALKDPPTVATMNLGWLTPFSPDEEYQRVVLHEFGHALGAIHEHQSPKSGIPWNRAKVLAKLSGPPNYWDEATIKFNVLDRYNEDSVNASEFDSLSIMLYPVSKELTLNGFEIPWRNHVLSECDKAWIEKMYGPPVADAAAGPTP